MEVEPEQHVGDDQEAGKKASRRHMTLPDLEFVAQKYHELKPVGTGKLLDHLPDGAMFTSLKIVLKKLKSGATLAQIWAEEQESRRMSGRKKTGDAVAGEVKALLAEDNSSKQHSQRKIASKFKPSVWSVNRIIKHRLKMEPMKLVRTTKNANKT